MSGMPAYDWSEANQACLAAEFARLKALLGEDEPTQEFVSANAPLASLEEHGDLAAIDLLARTFELSRFERDVLLLCAGVEMDAQLARLCAEAQGQPQRAWVTFGLALGALAEPHWSALTPVRPLRRWRLLEVDESANLAMARLKIDERILHYLAGINYLDSRLQSMLRPCALPGLMALAHAATAERIVTQLQTAEGIPPLLQLHGDDRPGQQDVAATVAARLGLQLHVIAASDIPSALQEQEALAVF